MDKLIKQTIALAAITLLALATTASIAGTQHTGIVTFTYVSSLALAVMHRVYSAK